MREDRLELRLKQGEMKLIEKRMNEAGMKNMSAYIRKMAIDGYVIRLDLSDVKEVSRLMGINSNNLNQYAKKANETGSIYQKDIEVLKEQHEKIWEELRKINLKLASIR
ncbi:MAG: plasmid mobilization relaxosome protein MobC [Lachnospiraceae bacterium]|nr:plasmid mobilization relaxosome protein MobC [Lachnospiraceae bacterium]